MAKVGSLIARSLRILRVIDPDENPEPEQYERAMQALNEMMATPKWQNMPLGWVDVDNPDDDTPLPAHAIKAVSYALAVDLRPEYGVTLDPDTEARSDAAFSELIAAKMKSSPPMLAPLLIPEPDTTYAGTMSDFIAGR